ncbi:C40 family peptidase [Deinococcus soli (ex Cha et al. 2016)]|uniref:C40 family peptidase n=1 Tax=Deinococcus soli (ex Cha et al. 2016) TaxID=1309411 RepID=UPI0019A86CB1|nr:C40 family peptidase [Deinococcus soli (ex Cha et al. 2016)]GGB56681.1 peptidase [Deinococcus soli (ex Cha et al. 2016)]
MTTPTLPDARTHASDPHMKIAEDALRSHLTEPGWRFVAPTPAHTGPARLSLRADPDPDAAQVTEALPGEPLDLLWENAGGWAYVRTAHDHYLGWARADGLHARPWQPDLTVTARRAHAYAGPKISQPIRAELAFGARLARGGGEIVTEQHRRWVPVTLPGGADAWVQEMILAPLDSDLLTFAQGFLDTPYVWGGRSAWGMDCSGLTQLVYGAFGRPLPRDADQQQAFLTPVTDAQPGDLAFFPGHVGLMLGGRRLLHANATHMRVTVETLGEGEYGTRLQSDLSGFGRWTQ